MRLDLAFWAGRRVLLTGHTGFKGAWLCLLLEHLGSRVTGVGLPPPAGGAYASFEPWTGVASHEVDVRDLKALSSVVEQAEPDVVLHLAAQALVPIGFADPAGTYSTNVIGTVNLLEACTDVHSVEAVVVVTSDKVYENRELGRPFRENDPLGGAGPYAGSKACAELVVAAYRQDPTKRLGLRTATARAGNVIGGGDISRDRLLPDLFRALAAGVPVEVRNPRAVRPWQFVLDPLYGYLLLAERLAGTPAAAPPAVNFGPPLDESVPVGDLLDRTLREFGRGSWVEVGESFPEAHQLRLDSSLAKEALGWSPLIDIDTAVRWTAEWHRTPPEGRARREVAVKQIVAALEMTP